MALENYNKQGFYSVFNKNEFVEPSVAYEQFPFCYKNNAQVLRYAY
jgi:hypothetical protein